MGTARCKLGHYVHLVLVNAIGAAVLYGLHQIFTKMASASISDGLGGLVVEGTAALTILAYLAWLRFSGHWNQKADAPGIGYSIATGICVGAGTILFFLLFQKRRAAVGGADGSGGRRGVDGDRGICLLQGTADGSARIAGIVMAIAGLVLLKS